MRASDIVKGFPRIDFDAIVLKGGVDQLTPTLSLESGYCRNALNFEVALQTGYSRIGGYERYDGRTSPSDNTTARQMVSVAAFTNTPSAGDTITGAVSGATGVVAIVDGLNIGMCKVVGTFQAEAIAVGATAIGTIDNTASGPSTPLKDAQFRNAIADIYRADIAAPTGSGSLLGGVILSGTVYVFRNNAGATAVDIWKESAAGWVNVPLFKTVSFTAGGAAVPAEGATLTQGAVTATLKRAALTSGEWAGSDAAGQLIITTVAGGNFAAGAATLTGGIGVTLSGAETQITLSPSGRFQFDVGNFFGGATTLRAYGCDNVNTAFEFDGTILVPIFTGAATDKPTNIIKHRDYLCLSVGTAHYMSVAGEPYNFTGAEGATVILTGDTITGYSVMPGDPTNSSLLITSRSNFSILYGKTSADFNFVKLRTGTGAVSYSHQGMVDTLIYDDMGVAYVQTAQDFGNFVTSTLTNRIQPLIKSNVGKVVASCVNRDKSQYRVFYNDGGGLYITISNGELLGCMPILFPDIPYCAFEGRSSTGANISFFGGTDGMLYQLDKGSSFDGDAMDWQFTLNYANSKSPRTKKKYRGNAAFEVNSEFNNTYAAFSIGYKLGYDAGHYSQPQNMSYAAYLAATRWDEFTWDDFFWDSNAIEALEVDIGGAAENIAFFVFGNSDYVMPFTINSIIIPYTPRRILR